jgi:hypothetical protein
VLTFYTKTPTPPAAITDLVRPGVDATIQLMKRYTLSCWIASACSGLAMIALMRWGYKPWAAVVLIAVAGLTVGFLAGAWRSIQRHGQDEVR